MSGTFQCGDQATLVAYLYDECDAADREAVAAHVHGCVACAREVEALGNTRRHLATWSPPAASLGFQITQAEAIRLREGGDSETGGTVLRPARWWSRPLPAWAQVAAAALIFTAGLAIGASRGSAPADLADASNAAGRESRVASTNQVAGGAATNEIERVSQDDLSSVEQRLRAEIAQLRQVNVAAPAPTVDETAVLRRVQALIEESEDRQRREFALRTAEVAAGLDAQRRADVAQFQRAFGQFQGTTGAEVRQHRQAITMLNDYLVNVSQRR